MAVLECVGALIKNDRNEVYVHRRTPDRRLLPGTWDIVGGHVEAGETRESALAREIVEETGWELDRIVAPLSEWEWDHDGVRRLETDYLVVVNGDLSAPRLEEGKHDASAWVGPDNLELMMEGRHDGDRRLRDVVARACRTRLTERLRLEPVSEAHSADLWRLHQHPEVARWHAGAWSTDRAEEYVRSMNQCWERDGAGKWIAYERDGRGLRGRGGLSWQTIEGRPRLEVGWTVHGDHWRRGYATEIGRAGLAYAFDELGADEVVAFTEHENTASRAVMERLAMHTPRSVEHNGEAFVLYTLSRADYLADQPLPLAPPV